MSLSNKSKQWLRDHCHDEYVKRAQLEGYRSRAVYKLIEIDQRDRLIKPNSLIVELGAAPGSWSQYISKRIGHQGKLIAVDRLAMQSLPAVDFIQQDFCQDSTVQTILQKLNGNQLDLVISDMAPNISGIRDKDQAESLILAEKVIEFAEKSLKLGGSVILKLFQGQEVADFQSQMRQRFEKVRLRKPKASRSKSREVYLVLSAWRQAAG